MGTDKGFDAYDPDTLAYGYGYLSLGVEASFEPQAPAGYTICSQGTTYTDEYDIEVNSIGTNGLCMRLLSGRLATLRIVDVRPEELTVDLTVWETP